MIVISSFIIQTERTELTSFKSKIIYIRIRDTELRSYFSQGGDLFYAKKIFHFSLEKPD